MIVEAFVLGCILYKAVSCAGVGLGTLAKYKALKRLIDNGRKKITVITEDGETVTST